VKPETITDGSVQSEVLRAIRSLASGEQHKIQDSLLYRLGCAYLERSSGKLIVPPTGAESHAEKGSALLLLAPTIVSNLSLPVCSTSSVVDGLARGDCWRNCLDSEKLTYVLAAIMLDYVAGYYACFELEAHARQPALSILNAWLIPQAPYVKVPSAVDLARNIFGDAWCTLRLDCDPRAIGSTIYKERPLFLPGLCPAQDVILSASLPDDVGYFT
jgi:hypothetical protein